jgi:hypothetical protein
VRLGTMDLQLGICRSVGEDASVNELEQRERP